jgi:S1-C subfamily serine protease
MSDAVPPAGGPDPEPLEPIEPIESTVPTEPTPTVETAPAAPAAPAAPPVAHDGTIRVHRWVVFGLVAFAVATIGFALGWIAAPGDSGSQMRGTGPSNQVPRDLRDLFGGNGPFANGGGNDNRGGNPGGGNGGDGVAPRPDGAFLGVVTSGSTNPAGAEIQRVVEAGPAGRAGLEQGDVITKVDGSSISGPQPLAAAVQAHDPGDSVTITYVRDGDAKTVDVKLADRSSTNQQLEPPRSNF